MKKRETVDVVPDTGRTIGKSSMMHNVNGVKNILKKDDYKHEIGYIIIQKRHETHYITGGKTTLKK